MNILLLGSGGREHALAWKIKQSSHCSKLFIAPGNPGTSSCGENVNIATSDFNGIAQFCIENQVKLLVVGPEDPLVNGIYDFFTSNPAYAHIIVVGPSAEAAKLEGSKAFAKAFMDRHGIPTASYREFTKDNYEAGIAYLKQHALPIVLKADGLAAGKGVVIAQSHQEALSTFEDMIQFTCFGAAGEKVVIEQFLAGIELSMFALTDGKEYVLLPEAKDYKRIGKGDTGPNTGGMGAVSPVPFANKAFMDKVIKKVVEPTIDGLDKEGLVYHGFVFFGLINVGGEPYVIEYNCRMGDPETEVVMPRIKSDVVDLFLAMANGKLSEVHVDVDHRSAATLVLVSGGYPGEFEKGKPITGLDMELKPETLIFYAGIVASNGQLVTNGGRVAAITSYGTNIKESVERSINTIKKISFDQMSFREDIGYEFLD